MVDNLTSEQEIFEIKKLFRALDADKNGTLSREEIAMAMTKLSNGKTPSAQEVESCFLDMDTDRDGCINEIEFGTAIVKWLHQVHDPESPTPGSRRVGFKRATSTREPDNKRLLSDIFDFFNQFKALPDYQEEQNRILSRPRGQLNCESLRFGFVVVAPEAKLNYQQSILEVINGGRTAQVEILQACWSQNVDVVERALSTVRLLLGAVEVFHSVSEKLENAPVLYAIYNAVTGSDQGGPVLGAKGSLLEGRPLPPVVDRLVELVNAPSEFMRLQVLALECLHLYVLGPRVPTPTASNIWHFSFHYTQQLALARNLLPRLLELLKLHALVTPDNQALLTAALNTLGALADGSSEELPLILSHLVREHVRVRDAVLDYLGQFAARSDIIYSVPLLRTTAATLAILCGHATYDVEGRPPAAVFSSVEEISKTLRVAFDAMSRLLQAPAGEVDEPALIHLATVFGLILPLIPLASLKSQCALLMQQLVGVLARPWRSVLAAKVAATRVNHCLVDVMAGKEGAAEWLAASAELHRCLKDQLEAGLSEGLSAVAVSAIQVIDEFLAAGLESDVTSYYYPTFLSLLRSSTLRPWVLSSLVDLCHPKAHLLQLLSAGYVEALFAGLIRLRVHANTFDAYSQVFELEPSYNTSLLLGVAQALVRVLTTPLAGIKFATISEPEHHALLAAAFQKEHIDSVRMLHHIVCDEVEAGRLAEEEQDLVPLLNECCTLLAAMRDLHSTLDTPVAYVLAQEVAALLDIWQPKLKLAVRNAQTVRHMRSPSGENMDVLQSLAPKRLPYLRHTVGSLEMELCVRPLWRNIDLNGAEIEERDRLFIVPATVHIESLYKALANFFSRLIHLMHSPVNSHEIVLVQTQEQFQQLCADAEREAVLQSASMPRVTLQAQLAAAGEINFQNASTVLQPREAALRQVHQVAQSHGIKVNASLMGDVYSFFQSQGRSEIDIELFVLFMREKLGVAEQASRPLFRAFDTDSSGTLSLSEIAVGLALLVEGSEDDRIIAAFNAYDADRSGTLDYEEVLNLVSVVRGVTKEVADYYTRGAYQFLGIPTDALVSLDQFISLVKQHQLPLEFLLPDIRERYYNQFHPPPPQQMFGGAAGGPVQPAAWFAPVQTNAPVFNPKMKRNQFSKNQFQHNQQQLPQQQNSRVKLQRAGSERTPFARDEEFESRIRKTKSIY